MTGLVDFIIRHTPAWMRRHVFIVWQDSIQSLIFITSTIRVMQVEFEAEIQAHLQAAIPFHEWLSKKQDAYSVMVQATPTNNLRRMSVWVELPTWLRQDPSFMYLLRKQLMVLGSLDASDYFEAEEGISVVVNAARPTTADAYEQAYAGLADNAG